MVSALTRLPSPSPVLSLPAQSVGETYEGTPSSVNLARSATPPLLTVARKEAVTKSGSWPRTFSKEG